MLPVIFSKSARTTGIVWHGILIISGVIDRNIKDFSKFSKIHPSSTMKAVFGPISILFILSFTLNSPILFSLFSILMFHAADISFDKSFSDVFRTKITFKNG